MIKNQKYMPLRRCMACNNQKEKSELLRIVKSKDGNLAVDLSGKKSGRGAYICKKEECLDKVIKSQRLAKSLNLDINLEFYEIIRGFII